MPDFTFLKKFTPFEAVTINNLSGSPSETINESVEVTVT